ncbi:unnamed protein product [Arabis nemorensis]|uniref:F-box domain-containing protein n=1 Tax=Arabis nemorensis TaxID=586526 RepID=A0A565BSG5_9BRAS|nr:unnamed protein product [Arabis nemorensis]
MDSLPDDLWAIILARLPLKTITASKLVCKQWKSIVESSFLRELFLSHHQNSHFSSWSLMCKSKNHRIQVLAHYGCEIWGLQRSLKFYIKSFITKKFVNHPELYRQARVVAYTDVGLVLIRVVSLFKNVSYFVANPVSQECVETDPPWFQPMNYFWPLGIATRTEKNGVLSGFKVVLLFDAMPWKQSLSLLVYSSDSGLWSPETVDFPFAFVEQDYHNSISFNGDLHWLARNSNYDEAVVSIDFYSAGPGSVCVTPFPDLEKVPKFTRACTTCQGFLMYMNVVSVTKDDESVEEKFNIWRLKSGEWQLVSEIAGWFNDIPLAINPFDAKSVYFWSKYGQRLLSFNFRNGKFVCTDKLEYSSEGRISSSVKGPKVVKYFIEPNFSSFVLPQWLHRIPNMVRKV